MGRTKTVTPDQEDEILLRVKENLEINSSRMSSDTVLRKSSILRIFHQENLYMTDLRHFY